MRLVNFRQISLKAAKKPKTFARFETKIIKLVTNISGNVQGIGKIESKF